MELDLKGVLSEVSYGRVGMLLISIAALWLYFTAIVELNNSALRTKRLVYTTTVLFIYLYNKER